MRAIRRLGGATCCKILSKKINKHIGKDHKHCMFSLYVMQTRIDGLYHRNCNSNFPKACIFVRTVQFQERWEIGKSKKFEKREIFILPYPFRLILLFWQKPSALFSFEGGEGSSWESVLNLRGGIFSRELNACRFKLVSDVLSSFSWKRACGLLMKSAYKKISGPSIMQAKELILVSIFSKFTNHQCIVLLDPYRALWLKISWDSNIQKFRSRFPRIISTGFWMPLEYIISTARILPASFLFFQKAFFEAGFNLQSSPLASSIFLQPAFSFSSSKLLRRFIAQKDHINLPRQLDRTSIGWLCCSSVIESC